MKHLLIVQNVPTQFDVPLYNELARSARFRLTVIYTQARREGPGIDAEIGRAPQWDHIGEACYSHVYLTPAQARRSAEVVAMIAGTAADLVLISGYYPPLHQKLVRPLRRRGFSVGLRSDNTLAHSNFRGLKGLLKKIILPVWLARYTSWHPVGTLARQYLEAVSHTRRRTYLFPYNVDNAWFAGESARHREHRAQTLVEMGFSPDDFIVLGIMKWHDREDPLVLVRAFRQLLARQARARLILVGDGPLRQNVEQMLEGIEDKVHAPGYLPYSSLPGLYGLADVFVHPAPVEPWGVSVNEAMACGVPVVISSGVGAAADLVEPGQTGFVFPAGDWQDLEDKLFSLSVDTDRQSMQAACRQKMWDWSYETTRIAFERALGVID
ncbi:MAG: glycosyltransferase family 4 protein [Halioglobus sp.]|nr:glycosyltransferase family 4 protein [Halioglobus sp.]